MLARRVLVLLAALAFAALAGLGPVRIYFNERNPLLSERLLGDPRAKLRVWRITTLADPTQEPDPSVVRTAADALRDDPSDVAALSALALYYNLIEDPRAGRFAALADAVTKRDRLSQIVLGQEAAERGDIAASMQHLTTAIVTSDRGRPEIFAVISRLSDRQDLRQALRPYVTDDTTWMREFLQFLLRSGPQGPIYAADILLRADPVQSAKLQQEIGGELFGFLVERQRFDLVRQLYPRVRRDRPDIARDASFSQATIDPTFGWLAWHSPTDASYGAEFNVDGERIVPLVYANDDRGVALKRVLMLPPGRYGLIEQRELFGGGEDGAAIWRLSCGAGEGMGVVWTGPEERLIYSSNGEVSVTIPDGCDVQLLELFVSEPRGGSGFEMLLERFTLRPRG
jgi:hypothetical protein